MIEVMNRWSHVNGIYQIYPRSFKDTDGDGIGDITGIIDKLDYIKGGEASLGVDAIWISPFYPSTMADFGYDITDYCDVDPLFGTLDDFKHLLKEAHSRQIRIMIDFVPNHTSHKHPWFVESSSSRDSNKRDWYIWHDPKEDGSEPNNWLSVAGGSAWKFDEQTGQYYLHSFLEEQPDLNWENPEVREAMKAVVEFWFDMGVDGLRADAVRWMGKSGSLDDNPLNPDYIESGGDKYGSQLHVHNRSSERLYGYLSEIAAVVEKYRDRILIFEDYPDNSEKNIAEKYHKYIELYKVNSRVAMPFNFGGMFTGFNAEDFRKFIDTFQKLIPIGVVPVYCFGNHDQSRIASRFGEEQARLIAMMQLTLPGFPVVYYGDEIAMQDVHISADEVQDSFEKRSAGRGIGRDPQRTPMQWSSHDKYAGFSTAKPWLPVPDDLLNHTVEDGRVDPESQFALYRTLLNLRSENKVLVHGLYITNTTEDGLFSYTRRNDEGNCTVVLNFSDQTLKYRVESPGVRIVSSSMRLIELGDDSVIELLPFEGAAIVDY